MDEIADGRLSFFLQAGHHQVIRLSVIYPTKQDRVRGFKAVIEDSHMMTMEDLV